MSKHVLAATHLDNERIVWLFPEDDPKADPGWRLRIDKEKGELAFFVEEQVLPERVNNPNANRVLTTHSHSMLKKSEIRWLRDVCDELLKLEEDW